MTDHNDTGATSMPWSYEIQYGPNDEEIYAWVYNHSLMVCTVKMHHARMIVQAVNAYEPLKARLAEIEGERDEARAALGRIAQPDDLAADPSNFGAFAEAYLNFAQHIARAALAAEQKED